MERLRIFQRAFYDEKIHSGAHRQNIKAQPIGVALFCIDFDKRALMQVPFVDFCFFYTAVQTADRRSPVGTGIKRT